MMGEKLPTLRELKAKRDELKNVEFDPRVREARQLVRAERRMELERVEDEIKRLQKQRPKGKPRWPENVPENVMQRCELYWKGTTEFSVFRIHCWNEHAVWTSYPSGGYRDNGGWNPTQASFELVSMTEIGNLNKPKMILYLLGRVSDKTMQEELDKLAEEMKGKDGKIAS